jgi:hypothetical protein
LVVPAHAEEHVRPAREVDDRLTGLGVAREHDAPLGAVEPVGQRVEEGLDVLRRRRVHLPVGSGVDKTGSHVLGENYRGLAGQSAPAIDEHALTQGVSDAGLPVVREGAGVAEDALRERLGQRGSVHTQEILPADGLVPAREEKAGVVDVVVEMMVREEEIVDLRGHDAGLDELPGGGRTAVEHDVLPADPRREGRPPAGGGVSRRPGAEDDQFGHVKASF